MLVQNPISKCLKSRVPKYIKSMPIALAGPDAGRVDAGKDLLVKKTAARSPLTTHLP